MLRGVGTLAAAPLAIGPAPLAAAEGAVRPRPAPRPEAGFHADIWKQVFETPLIDTHEHLPEEAERLDGGRNPLLPCDDWALLCSHYLDSDLLVAGMPGGDYGRFVGTGLEPGAKWRLLEPWWPAVRNTGYGQAVRIAMRELYGVEELSAATVEQVQAGYERTRRPGMYQHVLREVAGIESCQVNHLGGPFRESAQPDLLMQDLGVVGMFAGPDIGQLAPPAGIEVRGLADWHRVIGWWFDHCAGRVVAVKSQHAYARDIDYAQVPAEQAEPVFRKVLDGDEPAPAERKLLEDHLFWQVVGEATRRNLPVKLHTGYYAGHNSMPLARLRNNAGSAAELCRCSPDTRFVFMHVCYPYCEEMLAVAKQWAGATVDMCWAWIINPLAAKDYLKKHLVTAPSNKLLPFGGDYIPVEPVAGHAVIARRGIARALTELVDEGWLTPADAVETVPALLNGNARRIFRLAAKPGA